jgi:RNA polymerase sigma factor (sigma-70 family)
MPEPLPPELSALLDAADPAAKEGAWRRFVNKHSRLILTTAREACAGYDDGMERYTFLLDELKRNDFHRLRGYVADGRGKFTTWLVVVARRLCVDYHRKRFGRRRGVGDDPQTSAEWEMRSRLIRMIAEQVDPSDLPDSSAPNPEKQMRESDRHRAVERALSQLDARDHLLIKLRFEDEVPVRNIAKIMGFSGEVSVYRQLKRIYRTLRAYLQESGFDEMEA